MLGAHACWVWGGKNITPPLKKLMNSESPGFESPLPGLFPQGPPACPKRKGRSKKERS